MIAASTPKGEVVLKADYVGSTEYIIKALDAAEPGSSWAIGTELNLVRRLAAQHPDKRIAFLDRTICYCSTMNRIDLPHLVWALESLVAGRVVNRIEVDADTAHWARVALDRMLALPGVVLAPHIAWLTPETLVRSLEVARENCRRLAAGEALLHQVV